MGSPDGRHGTADAITVIDAEIAATEARITALSRDVERIIEASALVATDDEHDPEGATIAFERAQASTLLDEARAHRAALVEARRRVGSTAYGVCERCGEPIGAGRLEARPTATTCIGCASAR
jgi:DnaK suppressor protein